jgi:RNA polymerase sigma-70 factor (ECF subfamily)
MADPISTTLFLRFRQGDQQALGILLDHLRPYARVIIRNMREDDRQPGADESDLIQEAFLQATNSAGTFQGVSVGELVRWLRTIVIRTTYRSLQSADEMACTDPEEANLATLVVDPGPAPADEAVRHEQSASMAVALSRLPEEMQQVLRGRLADDLDYATLSTRLGRSSGAVRVLFVRALRKLRDVWSEEFESH